MDDLRGLLDRVRSRLGADAVGFLEFRGDEAVTRLVVARNDDRRWARGQRLPLDALPGVCSGEAGHALLPDIAGEPGARATFRDWGPAPGAYLGAPVRLGTGQPAGVLCALYRDAVPHLGVRDLDALVFAASLLGPELVEAGEAHDLRSRARERLRLVVRDGLRMAYQPIVELASGRVVAVEALARFDTAPARPPNLWFAEAAQLGMGIELEIAAVQLALADLDRMPEDALLTVNVSIATLLSGAVHEALPPRRRERVVLEVTENATVPSYTALLEAFAGLRAEGTRLAIDDLGAGFAGLSHLTGLRPDVVKVDRGIVRYVGEDAHHDALIAAIVDFGRATGAAVVGEGIETPAQLAALQQTGVGLGQGYLVAVPGEPTRLRPRYPVPAGVPQTG